MKIKVNANASKTVFRFYDEKDVLLCVAFKPKSATSINTYYHKDYNASFKDIKGVALKPDIKEHPDNYEYRQLIKPAEKQAPLEAIKEVLKSALKDVQFVTITKLPGKKTPAKKPTTKKPDEKKGQTLKSGVTLVIKNNKADKTTKA